MTALEKLNKLAEDVYAENKRLRSEYKTLAAATALMAKHGARTIEDALRAEAFARVAA